MMKLGKGAAPKMAPPPMQAIGATRAPKPANKGTSKFPVGKPKLRMAGSMRGK